LALLSIITGHQQGAEVLRETRRAQRTEVAAQTAGNKYHMFG
jgi:hypothetical protein